ncbi:MAG: 50S ribosomal protein L24 [Ignavibacteriales bacterium]|nr:50S ribosomal protein L24 [Ignavibacteriales bacterium]MCF8315693.1 50S ribosomal protein L24 [Ignavibacteriales bacterium]MCF8437113.1 50S ribosomal protein L24 [Ignavibacteriales bacterium]
MKIKKDDKVMVVAGNSKGSTGKVLKVFAKKERVIVEGVNLRKRHTKPNSKNPQGGIIEKELPIHVSNVMIVDPKSNAPVRVGKKIIIDENTGKEKRARISRKSEEMI